MVIYPIPVAVTQAKVQLVIDETAKRRRRRSVRTCRTSLPQSQAEREALLDRKA
jgi:hypothetical protein